MDKIFEEPRNFIIGILEKRLDGEKWSNLFGSMQSINDRLTGKAITTTYQIHDIFHNIPIEVYFMFEFLSFAIRFVVGRGLIHDNERGCIFHRKAIKQDIIDSIKAGYISLHCQNQINKYLELDQIIAFRTILSILSEIARSEIPQEYFNNLIKADNESSIQDMIQKNERNIKIFISYAKEDFDRAFEIYEILRDKKYKPWIDEMNLLPGQIWKVEIQKAIKESDYFIACLSSNSVSKDGFFQKELKEGLEIFDYKHEGSIYLIPVRLDDCQIPGKFKEIQFCDLFKDNGMEKLLKTIEKAQEWAKKRIKSAKEPFCESDLKKKGRKKEIYNFVCFLF
jgi:hypothetical protein